MLTWIWRVGLAAFLVVLSTELIRFYAWRSHIARQLLSQSSVIETNYGAVEYADRGKGPAVLLIHGTPGGYDQVLSFVDAGELGQPHVRFIMPSRPGYLRTPISSGKTPQDQARLFAALLAKLKIGKVVVIGASGGGPSALAFVLHYPEKCSALVLEEAVIQHTAVSGSRVPPLLVDFLLFAVREAMRLQPTPREPEQRIMTALQIGQIESLVPYGKRLTGQSNDYDQFAQLPRLPLAQIHAPTLILHGTEDKDVPIAHAEYAHAQIAHSEFVKLENADHRMVVTLHAEISRIVSEFIARHVEQYP